MNKSQPQNKNPKKTENNCCHLNETDLDVFDPVIAYSFVATIQKISAIGYQGVKIQFSEPDSAGKVRIQYFFNYSTIEGVIAFALFNAMHLYTRPLNTEKVLKFIENQYIASGYAAPVLFDAGGDAK